MKAKRSEGEKRDEGTELLHISFFFFFRSTNSAVSEKKNRQQLTTRQRMLIIRVDIWGLLGVINRIKPAMFLRHLGEQVSTFLSFSSLSQEKVINNT